MLSSLGQHLDRRITDKQTLIEEGGAMQASRNKNTPRRSRWRFGSPTWR